MPEILVLGVVRLSAYLQRNIVSLGVVDLFFPAFYILNSPWGNDRYHNRIVVIGRRGEILTCEVFIHAIGIVVHPAEGVGIYINHFFFNERRAVVETFWTIGKHCTFVFFFNSRGTFFLCSLAVIGPIIFIVQLSGVDGATTVETVFLR